MKILVCVKRVGSIADDVEFVADDRGVDPDYLDFALNEWDAFAVEEALRLRDAHGGEVVVTTVGDSDSERELRRCLAMGADRAIRINAEFGAIDPITVAGSLAEVARAERPDLIVCGAQSSDFAQGVTGSALAGLLELPVIAVVKKVEVDAGERKAFVQRELEAGLLDVCETDLPAVLTIQTGINEPRYVTMRAMQEASDGEIAVRELAESAAGYRIRRMFRPSANRAEMIAGGPAEVARRILEIAGEVRAL